MYAVYSGYFRRRLILAITPMSKNPTMKTDFLFTIVCLRVDVSTSKRLTFAPHAAMGALRAHTSSTTPFGGGTSRVSEFALGSPHGYFY